MESYLSRLATTLLLMVGGALLAGCGEAVDRCASIDCGLAGRCEVREERAVCIPVAEFDDDLPGYSPYPDTYRIPGPTEEPQQRSLVPEPNAEFATGYFSFRLAPKKTYRFSCSSVWSECIVRLLHNGRPLVSRSSVGAGFASDVEFWSAVPVTYYLEVSARPFSVATISWELHDLGPDDHGHLPADATPLVLPMAPLSGQFEWPSDEDIFHIDLLANHTYRSTCITPPGMFCPVSVASEALGQGVASHPGGSAQFKVKADGKHTIRLGGAADGQGPWSYQLEDLGPDSAP